MTETSECKVCSRYAAYYRVSTKQQGDSGLGLEAQQAAVKAEVERRGGSVEREFSEVESGRNTKRPILQQAIDFSGKSGCVLVVAKLDRLGRNAVHLQRIKESLEILVCDMPEMDSFMFGLFALMAEREAETIRGRVRAALAAKKARGEKLGKPENLTDETRARGRMAKRTKAQGKEANIRAYQIARDWRAQGQSYRRIADKLNAYGLKGAAGGRFHAVTVSKLLKLYQ